MAVQNRSTSRSPADQGPDRRARREPPGRDKRRAEFLAELAEAKALRARVAPRRARMQELHRRLLRTFRY
ncbi:MAG TPA: hypothetical protein VGX23_35785 [Actinocrinis sp.]|nr:hypothetical protein [Actinocrinis sp.]